MSPSRIPPREHRLAGSLSFAARVLLGTLALLATSRSLAAQQTVAPEYSTASVEAGSTSYAYFQLVNNDPSIWYVDLSCVPEGEVTSCSVEPTSEAVPGIEERAVTVTFTTGAAGSGRVTLIAGGAVGVLDVTLTPPQTFVVEPDGQTIIAPPGQRSRQAFTVTNNFPQPYQYTVVPSCTGSGIDVSSCHASVAGLYLRPGESTHVTVSYTTLPAAGSGTIVLRVSAGFNMQDTGYVNVSVPAPSLAMVRIAPSTPGVTVEKDQCVNFSLRREVSAQCAVLRVVHQIPGVRTRNTGRAPTLVYYYDLAYRRAVIGVDVTMAPSTTYQGDDSVRVSISRRVSGQCVSPESKTYSAVHWFSGTPGARSRRVGVSIGLDSSGNSYIRQYCLDATLVRSTGPQPLAPVQYGEFAVVQRYTSAFGTGWWLAGLEELFLNQPDSIGGGSAAILWVGGDASTRRYRCRSACNGVYFPDDLVDRKDSLVLSGGEFTRFLPHGLKVVFDASGRHVRTVNRHGAVTTFAYSGSTRQLLSVSVPPASAGLAFNFIYTAGRLTRIDAPSVPAGATRSVNVQSVGTAVTGFVDPDNRAVSFSPPAGGPLTLIERMVDRRGVATDFHQEAWHPAVASVRTVLGGGREQWQWFRTPGGLSARPVTSQAVPDSAGEAYLRVTDGRNNITRIWSDRLGAPTKIVSALGNSTLIDRGDPRWPGLATKVVQPNGHTVSAQYDEHGNIAASYDVNPLGDARNAITRYHWNQKWDFVDSIVTPLGLATTFDYDNVNGNRLWQQTGPDQARRVSFSYYTSGAAAGLLRSILVPGTRADTVWYDARLANDTAYRTPLGYLTQRFNDAVGRITETREQVDVSGTARMRRTSTSYDLMSRDTMTVAGSLDPAEPVAAVRRTLDIAGDDSVVTRWTSPDPALIGNMVTKTFRDALGRVVKEVAADGHADSTVYDAAGNVIKTINRNGDSVTFAYDSLNRMRRRATAAKHFDVEDIGLARGRAMSPDPVEAVAAGWELNQSYPWGRPGGYDIPAVIDTFVYHPTNMTMTDANNAFAVVHFDYYPNGQLSAEQSTQRPWDGGTGPSHIYRQSITYDPDGRRSTLTYPSAISPASGATVTYAYAPSGDLMRVRDFDGRATTFTVNPQGQLARRELPGGSSQLFTYDQDGNLTTDTVIVGSPVRKQQFTYDARRSRTSMVDGVGPSDNSAYNALGQLTFSTNSIPSSGSTSTSYTLDALGNIAKRSGAEASITWVHQASVTTTTSNNGDEWQFYKPGTGRLWYTKIVPNPDTTGQSQGGGGRPAMMNWYDAAGNQAWTGSAILRLDGPYADAQSERRMYYGPDGKLRAVDARALYRAGPSGTTSRGFARSFEEYRYDALGRRVATRFDQSCDDFVEYNRYNAPCHVSGIRRTIWDGSQELGEIQLPSEHLENDTYVGQGTVTPNSINLAPHYGAVAYIHDGQVDQPLAVTRLRYSNLTPSNTISELAAFTFYPVWDIHGIVPNLVGMGPLPAAVCPSDMAGGTKATCLSWVLQQQWLPYRDVSTLWPRAWQGTLLQDKAGAGGLMYRRNRYYDSKSGRFTQEDPIGLAGGLNLYGYAGGDPVSYSDPFGLCTPWPECLAQGLANWGAVRGGAVGDVALNVGAAANAALEAGGVNDASAGIAEISQGNVGKGLFLLGTSLPTPAGKGGKILSRADVIIETALRKTPGGDGGIAAYIKEKVAGKTISVTQQVTVGGKIVHQHQEHIGKYGTHRRFPDEWVEHPHIGVPD